MLRYYVIAIAIFISPTISAPLMQNGEYVVPEDPVKCANDLIDWCNGMQYPSQGAGLSLVSISINEPSGFYRYFCTSDSDGTNCTRNGSPWFACSSDNILYYKEKPLTKHSTDVIDGEICHTANRAFNDLYVQNMSFDNATAETVRHELEKGMETFFQEMANMQRQIGALQDRLSNVFGPGFPFGNSNPFNGFPFGNNNPTTLSPVPGGKNQVERE